MPFWEAVLGAFVGGAVTAALTLWWARRNREPWPELEDVMDAHTKLAHRVKMVQGRLNQVAPPREGTGEGSVAPEPIVTLSPAEQRRLVLKRWRDKGA